MGEARRAHKPRRSIASRHMLAMGTIDLPENKISILLCRRTDAVLAQRNIRGSTRRNEAIDIYSEPL